MKRIETNATSILKNSAFINRSFVQVSLMLIFTLLTNITLGQKEDYKTIEGTFKDKRITGLDHQSVNHKSNYSVRLDNLNTALYKVQFKFNDFDWETETPTVLEQLLPKIENYTGSFSQESLIKGFHDGIVNNDKTRDSLLNEKLTDLAGTLNEKIRFINMHTDMIQKASVYNVRQISLDVLNSMGTDTIEYREFLAEFQNSINYLKGFYSALKEFNKESPNGDFMYVQMLANMEGLVNQLNMKNYPKLFGQIVSWARKAPDNFADSDVHFPDKEVTSLQIIVIDRFDPSDTICNYTTDIYRTGVFKIDFSTGIGINSLVKPTYSMANNGTPYIHKENGRDADLSVMALLHANWRLSRNFTFGPTAGVSVSTFDANTGFVLGISGSFGTRNTISLSTGGIMGKSYKLSSRVSSDGNKADIPLESGITEIPKVDAVNYGWFVSITYNLTRIKKKP